MQPFEVPTLCGRCLALDERNFPEGGNLGGWCFLYPTYDFDGIGLDLRAASTEAARVAVTFGARLHVFHQEWSRLKAITDRGGHPHELEAIVRPEALAMAAQALESIEGSRPSSEQLATAFEDVAAKEAYNRNRTDAINWKDGHSWGYFEHFHNFLKSHPNADRDRELHRELFQLESRIAARHLIPECAPFQEDMRLRKPLPAEVSPSLDRADLTGHFLARLLETGPQVNGSPSFVDAFRPMRNPEKVREFALRAATGDSPKRKRDNERAFRDKGWGERVWVDPEELAEAGPNSGHNPAAEAAIRLDVEAIRSNHHPGLQILVDRDLRGLSDEEVASKHGVSPRSLESIEQGARAFLEAVSDPGVLDCLPGKRHNKQRKALAELVKGKTMAEVAQLLGMAPQAAQELVLKASTLLGNCLKRTPRFGA